MKLKKVGLFALLLLWLVLAAGPAAALEGVELKINKGETLKSIKQKYFRGEDDLWKKVLEYNNIQPGTEALGDGMTLKLPLDRAGSVAGMLKLQNDVSSKKMLQNSWGMAYTGQKYNPKDTVKTGKKSFAVIEYIDKNRIDVNENSYFLILAPSLRKYNRGELLSGSVEMKDIIVVSAEVTAEPMMDGTMSKMRMDKEKNTSVAVLGGRMQVDAGGGRVEVPGGYGTYVKYKQPPSEPEKLLEPPLVAGFNPVLYSIRQPVGLSWEAVDNADGYFVEIAADEKFENKLDRFAASGPSAVYDTKKDGIFYWRVCSVNKSGIEGAGSAAKKLLIDTAPPRLKKLKEYILPAEDETDGKVIVIAGIIENPVDMITANGEAVEIDSYGYFEHKISAIKSKIYNLDIVLSDMAGNMEKMEKKYELK